MHALPDEIYGGTFPHLPAVQDAETKKIHKYRVLFEGTYCDLNFRPVALATLGNPGAGVSAFFSEMKRLREGILL